MKILYLTQYFPPEAGATQTRAYEMGKTWVELGHKVTIITEVPNHPSGIIAPEYRGKLFNISSLEGMHVIRVWVKASPKKTFTARMAFYLSYLVGAILAGLFLTKDSYDLIYASSPPLFVGSAAYLLSRIKKIPMVFEVRDLWPEAAVELGELKNQQVISWATQLEESYYQHAHLIIVVTRGIQARLVNRGVPPGKIHLIPNGANTEMFRFSLTSRLEIRTRLNLEQKFVAIYSGIFGIAQGLESIIEAAILLKNQTDIHFLLIGDGPRREAIIDMVSQSHLDNVTILPEMPREVIPDYLSAADIALVPLRKIPLFQGALPSKIFDAWACERPVLLTIDGEAREILDQARGGVYIPAEDPAALASMLVLLKDYPDRLEHLGKNGRVFTTTHFSRRTMAIKLIDLLSNPSSSST